MDRPTPHHRSAWLSGFLLIWVALSVVLNLTWDSSDPPLVPIYEALARELPPGDVGLVSGRGDRDAGYSLSAARYALSPRPVRPVPPIEERRWRRRQSMWLIADQVASVSGYEHVRDLGGGVALLRRK